LILLGAVLKNCLQLSKMSKRYPLNALLDACRRYPLSRGRRITFEYVLLKGVKAHYPTFIRASKGRDIQAACGQLRGLMNDD